jgi:hypothetical protein
VLQQQHSAVGESAVDAVEPPDCQEVWVLKGLVNVIVLVGELGNKDEP